MAPLPNIIQSRTTVEIDAATASLVQLLMLEDLEAQGRDIMERDQLQQYEVGGPVHDTGKIAQEEADKRYAIQLANNDQVQEIGKTPPSIRAMAKETTQANYQGQLKGPETVIPIRDGGLDGRPLQQNPQDTAPVRADPPEPKPQEMKEVTCVVCLENFTGYMGYNIAQAPCDHYYCRNCLQDLFRRSLTDEDLFPPRCCGKAITPISMENLLLPALLNGYERRKQEFETPNRTYCSNQRCSEFIPTENIRNDRATCLVCDTETCTRCKAAAHHGACTADPDVQKVLQIAAQNKWRRCAACSQMVERSEGCNKLFVRFHQRLAEFG